MWLIIPCTRTHSLLHIQPPFPHETLATVFATLLEKVPLRSCCAPLTLWTGGVFGAGCRNPTAFIQDPPPYTRTENTRRSPAIRRSADWRIKLRRDFIRSIPAPRAYTLRHVPWQSVGVKNLGRSSHAEREYGH